MTETDAIALADKRNRHKSKYQSDVIWQAVHNSTRGWHVALMPIAQPEKQVRPLTPIEAAFLLAIAFGRAR